MASDLAEWQPDDFALFSKLLRIDRSQVISHRRPLSDRNGYFGEIEHPGDLFLDPDTGIATGKVSAQHVAPAEIAALLKSTDRLLAIYQHVRAQRVWEKIKGVGSLYSGRVESGRKRSAETSGFPDTRVEPLAAITGGEENILASRNKGV